MSSEVTWAVTALLGSIKLSPDGELSKTRESVSNSAEKGEGECPVSGQLVPPLRNVQSAGLEIMPGYDILQKSKRQKQGGRREIWRY